MYNYKALVSLNGKYCYDVDFRHANKEQAREFSNELKFALKIVDKNYKIDLIEWSKPIGMDVEL